MKQAYPLMPQLFLLLMLFACTEKSIGPDGPYKVGGVIYHANLPLSGATVTLDKAFNYTVLTDENGVFEISDVALGDHEIEVKKSFSDSSFTTQSGSVYVDRDLVLERLILPRAIVLHEIQNITSISLTLSWSPTDASDFREYKLFRHTTSGLDEKTGTLVHVSTSINDTTFTDSNLSPVQQYYYRVYVMNDFGLMGGSNIPSAETEPLEIIRNGDFEQLEPGSPMPTDWSYHIANYEINTGLCPFVIDSLNAQSGNYCLRVQYTEGIHYTFSIKQHLDPALLGPGQYEISLWLRSIPDEEFNGSLVFYDDSQRNSFFDTPVDYPATATPEWQRFSYQFYLSDHPIIPNLNFNLSIWRTPKTLYIDNISLMKVQ